MTVGKQRVKSSDCDQKNKVRDKRVGMREGDEEEEAPKNILCKKEEDKEAIDRRKGNA